jgi:hypothetical protein
MHRWFLLILIGLLTLNGVYAQDTPSGTVNERRTLRAGPSDTYPLTEHELVGDTTVNLLERNALGNWVRVSAGEAVGWIPTGDLTLEGVSVAELSVTTVADASLELLPNPTAEERLLYTTPIIPDLSGGVRENIRTTYAWGQAQGNGQAVVTKVGDSNMTNQFILPPVSYGYQLSPYTDLQPTVDAFGDSFGRESIATQRGLNTASVFDPFWASPNTCEADESPLSCEYRETQPTIAVIMFGQNDMRVMSREEYQERLTRIVQETLEAGIIPILCTFASTPDDEDYYHQSLHFNAIAIRIAAEYDVPLLNFWLATRSLSTYGVGEDDVHFTSTGSSVQFDRGQESDYGLSLYNLAVLRTLEQVRQVIAGE